MRKLAAMAAFGAVGAALAGLYAGTTVPSTAPPLPARVVNSVTSFASSHPEWAVLRDGRKDTSAILMGHAKHLHPDLPGGPLTCVSCHVPDASDEYMQPVKFESHCQRCHEGDLRSINVGEGLVEQVPTPHASADVVREFIAHQLNAMVASHPEKFIVTEGAPAADAAEQSTSDADESTSSRRRGRGRSSGPEAIAIPAFGTPDARAAWLGERAEEASAKAHASCSYCHAVTELSDSKSMWQVQPPAIPDRWLPRSQFSHGAHSMLRCGQCHAAEGSVSTEDILLPGIDSCRECHQPHSGALGGAPAACVVCHTYHAPAPVREGTLNAADLHREAR